jgi:hypothetical protein
MPPMAANIALKLVDNFVRLPDGMRRFPVGVGAPMAMLGLLALLV